MALSAIIALLACTSGATAQNVETFKVKAVSFKMIKVEGGSFQMGTTPDQGDASVKQPVRDVKVNTFSMGETEVTQGIWSAVMGTNPSVFKTPYLYNYSNSLPVENVSLEDCKEFIKKLNKITNRKFRLPTEEEWEYAARGGKKAKPTRYAGSNNIDEVGWYAQNSGDKQLGEDFSGFEARENNCRTRIVADKTPNELGIYDMTGNVGEWTDTKYTRSSSKSERGKYIIKGGDYSSRRQYCPVSEIGVSDPDKANSLTGLRLALSE